MKDELKRNFYIKEVSAKYDIYESVLYRELDRWLGERGRSVLGAAVSGAQAQRAAAQSTETPSAESPQELKIPAAERDLLKLLLEHPSELVSFIFSYVTLSDFSSPQVRAILDLLLARFDERGPVNATELVHEIEHADLKSIVTDVVLSRYELSKQWQSVDTELEEADPWTIARGAIVALKKQHLQKEIVENQRLLKEASDRGGDTMEFVRRHQDLMRQLKEVESSQFFESG